MPHSANHSAHPGNPGERCEVAASLRGVYPAFAALDIQIALVYRRCRLARSSRRCDLCCRESQSGRRKTAGGRGIKCYRVIEGRQRL
jgi:hypothetical protein